MRTIEKDLESEEYETIFRKQDIIFERNSGKFNRLMYKIRNKFFNWFPEVSRNERHHLFQQALGLLVIIVFTIFSIIGNYCLSEYISIIDIIGYTIAITVALTSILLLLRKRIKLSQLIIPLYMLGRFFTESLDLFVKRIELDNVEGVLFSMHVFLFASVLCYSIISLERTYIMYSIVFAIILELLTILLLTRISTFEQNMFSVITQSIGFLVMVVLIAVFHRRQNVELERIKDKLKDVLRERNKELEQLEKILPICSRCKKILTESGDWEGIEDYLKKENGRQFTHTLCNKCAHELYPDLLDYD